MMKRSRLFARPAMASAAFVTLLSGCTPAENNILPALGPTPLGGTAADRVNGAISPPQPLAPIIAFGNRRGASARREGAAGEGQYTLDFADMDVREVVAQVMGRMLRLNYVIDPAVKGTVTLRTPRPLEGSQVLPALQTLLSSVGASVVKADGLYRIIPAATAAGAGSVVVGLRYVSSEALMKVLQPIAGNSAKIASEGTLNALLISGDPGQVQSMVELVHSFDIDALAGQSYAILPVASGGAKEYGDSLQEALRGKSGGGLSGLVRVVALPRMNAVLIASTQPGYIEQAKRLFEVMERQRRANTRTWHVYYLQNGNANDVAFTLQSGFTPNRVTALPESTSRARNSGGTTSGFGGNASGGGSGSTGGGARGGSITQANAGSSGGTGLSGAGQGTSANPRGDGATAAVTANPLLGGLDPSGGGGASGQDESADAMRILPNGQNNAILIYGTGPEQDAVLALLHKIDILPMQVRIDATIAEVTLNDALQYGTQFFFKSGGINGVLSTAASTPTSISSAPLGLSLPGFIVGGHGENGAPFAISALQAVTTVKVLSSPQITVVDNEPARLQVGALVPYLTASSQSTLTANAPVINSIAYQPTGVIMEVTPRVNSGGLVTLDVSQEVSDVQSTTTTAGINSPTFDQRSVTSRVVVQDGQTIGLAGLIRDTVSRGNSGLPWLKDVPILGALAGTQNNSRTRTELLVMLTPHVIRSQTDARSLTEDMRSELHDAAAVPATLRRERLSGSSDPNKAIRDGAARVFGR